jgi:hypothetical protein
MRTAAFALGACLTLAPLCPGWTQAPAGIAPRPSSAEAPAATQDSSRFGARGRSLAIIASLILPGAGQALLRQERFVPYAAAEAFFLMRYAQHSRDARRERDRYRALASNVARSPFASARPHGTFEYYESMASYLESGAFDAVAGGELDPEPDTATFNGRIWLLARRTYWRDVATPPTRDSREWRLAESFYASRAVRPEFRWSWRDAQLEYDEFRRTIRRANDAFRDALTDLSVIIANHALSGVDALVSVRLQSRVTTDGRSVGIWATIPFR